MTGPATGGTSVTITGADFTGATAVDFGGGPATSFQVNSDSTITAIDPSGSVGTVAVTVTGPGGVSPATTADEFTYTRAVQATYTCPLPAPLGATGFPVVLSEIPSAPSSVTSGATFQTAARRGGHRPGQRDQRGHRHRDDSVHHRVPNGDGRRQDEWRSSERGGQPEHRDRGSHRSSPDRQQFCVQHSLFVRHHLQPGHLADGAGTGQVDLVPGNIVVVTSYVMSGKTTSLQLNCTAPSNVAALDSTTVNPETASPSFQVPTTTPPLQNQVSGGTDGGWSTTVSNTSTVAVSGLAATISVTDGGAPLTYDLSAMTATGSNCSTAGSGKVSCSLANLASGASETLTALVNTKNLAQGTSIRGSAVITSSDASSHTSALGAIEVIVVQNGNGTEAVAAPGIAVSSTKRPLARAKASVTLTLPTKRIRRPAAGQAEALAAAVAAAASTSPPPVAVTLESLAPSAEPALCPPTGTSKCEGNIIQAVGNFSAYTNKKAPIVAVLKFFYGLHVPTGTIYMLKPNGKTVVKLAACKKHHRVQHPCVAGPEQVLGSASHDSLYAQDTVYFTGADPAMGRR